MPLKKYRMVTLMVSVAALVVIVAIIAMYMLIMKQGARSANLNMQIAVMVGVVTTFIIQLMSLAKLAYTQVKIEEHNQSAAIRANQMIETIDQTKEKIDETREKVEETKETVKQITNGAATQIRKAERDQLIDDEHYVEKLANKLSDLMCDDKFLDKLAKRLKDE